MKKFIKLLTLTSILSFSLISCSNSTVTNKGYYKADIDYGVNDLNPSFAPTIGHQKALVILIAFDDGEYTFDDSTIKDIQISYFGNRVSTPYRWNSLNSYYQTASYDQLSLNGQITAIYHTSVSSASIKAKEDEYATKDSFKDLYTVYNAAINDIKSGKLLNTFGTAITFADYDGNNDGYIDSPTFITNVNDDDKWSSTFWPHMDDAINEVPGDWNFKIYSSTNVGQLNFTSYYYGARTAIHEQGHVFGLDDYYDYTSPKDNEKTIDLLGYYDMQDSGSFDWNSYSKMIAKWVDPYVVDGTADTATINIGDAAETGDCILIPANYSTWNGTPYDEYLLLELFSPYGNNKMDWDYNLQDWNNLGECGIRLYHVDSRLYGFDDNGGEWIDSPKTTTYTKFEKPTNCSDNESYSYTHLPDDVEGCHLLQIVQAGKINTFEDTSLKARHTLNSSDLFHTGDSFTFDEYKDFFGKKTTMNNGESFNYTIDFTNVSSRNAAITISKNN
jgi:M6 family metalloprotease-like protein